jgi:transposase
MDLSSLILPQEIFDNFTLIRVEESSEQVDLYLDELSIIPDSNGIYISKGFTPYSIIQDYPLRGRAVYLHIRRRKWQDQSTGDIFVCQFDIAHEGTRLSKEFAVFLKEAHRLFNDEHQDYRRNVSG